MIKGLLIALVRGYQLLISPLLGPRCRFFPTCSNYALEAVQVHGPLKGSWLALRRIGRCHPWHEGGVDLVPRPEHAGAGADPGQPPAGGPAVGGSAEGSPNQRGPAERGPAERGPAERTIEHATIGASLIGASLPSRRAACGCHHH